MRVTEERPATPGTLLERGMEILGCFDAGHTALTLTQIAQLTGLPLSTCHRITTTLCNGGFLSRGSDRRFRVGTRLWTIAQQAPLNDRLRESALPTLARLYEETGENVTLAVLDRGQALYVDRLVGERSVPTVIRGGGHLPLHTTGVGKVLLAAQTDAAIEAYLSHPLPRPTLRSITDPDALRRDLAEVRERGYAITRQEMSAGSGSVAVPILRGGTCVAAVGVVVHMARLDVGRLVATLNQAARVIEAGLGDEG
ncbi:IclR family transcriptional regulator [Leifsonia kafniensis]